MSTEKPILRYVKGESPAVIMERARKALAQAGRIIELREFLEEATKADYSHFVATCDEWFRQGA